MIPSGIKMKNLARCMHPRIRSARTNCTDWLAENSRKGILYVILNRLAVALFLPTIKSGPVIGTQASPAS
jgi:hypothetical protein